MAPFSGQNAKIAILLFGLPRSLRWTVPSIRDNIIAPFSEIGEVRTYAHFNLIDVVTSDRSGEHSTLPPLSFDGLSPELVQIERQGRRDLTQFSRFMEKHDLATKSGGSYATDNRNFLNALHSLQSVWKLFQSDQGGDCADAVIFLRSDLYYRDKWDARSLYGRIASGEYDLITPDWHEWGGLNDRFAIASPAAADLYANRISQIETITSQIPVMNAESILASWMSMNNISTGRFSNRAHRVRANGRILREKFPVTLDFLAKSALWRLQGLSIR